MIYVQYAKKINSNFANKEGEEYGRKK